MPQLPHYHQRQEKVTRLQLLPACEWLGILNKPGFAGAATLGPGQVVAEIGTHPLGQLGQALATPG